MPERQSFALDTPSGRVLPGILDLPDTPGRRPTVLDCHGFKSFQEWGFHPYLADLLAARGFTVVRFNLGSSGMQPGDDLVTDEEAFARRTFGDDLEDIDAVLTALTEDRLAAGRVDTERLGLLGHSRGGGLSIVTAGSERWRGRLRALVTWAAISTWDRIDEEAKQAWRESGRLPIVNGRTGQELFLDASLIEDGEGRLDEYDVRAAAARIETPWLLVHGTEDETVPVAEAGALQGVATGSSFESVLVEGGNHTFGATHPLGSPNPHLTTVLNATQTWFRRHLSG